MKEHKRIDVVGKVGIYKAKLQAEKKNQADVKTLVAKSLTVK